MIFGSWCRCSDWWQPHTHDPETRQPIPFFDAEEDDAEEDATSA